MHSSSLLVIRRHRSTSLVLKEELIQIFNVRYKIMKSQGKDVDFYTFVGIAREDASTNDAIARAYRKRSLLWQYIIPALTN